MVKIGEEAVGLVACAMAHRAGAVTGRSSSMANSDAALCEETVSKIPKFLARTEELIMMRQSLNLSPNHCSSTTRHRASPSPTSDYIYFHTLRCTRSTERPIAPLTLSESSQNAYAWQSPDNRTRVAIAASHRGTAQSPQMGHKAAHSSRDPRSARPPEQP